MSFNRFIYETTREHPKLRALADRLFPADFCRQWRSVQERRLEPAVLGMLDFRDRCFQSALFRGDLLEDIAATDQVAGSGIRVVVTNLTEPDDPEGRHLVQLMADNRLIESIFVTGEKGKKQSSSEVLRTIAPLVGVSDRERLEIEPSEVFHEFHMAETLLSHTEQYAFRVARPLVK